MSTEAAAIRTLLLGMGNVLLCDDGIGIHVIRALDASQRTGRLSPAISLRDGGTLGLNLLMEFDGVGTLIVIDAMELGGAPGTVRAFVGADMDEQLGGKCRTAHEVALADLMTAAVLAGRAPERRALVAVQPASMQWGLDPTAAVRAAIPAACDTVLSLLEDWDRAARSH